MAESPDPGELNQRRATASTGPFFNGIGGKRPSPSRLAGRVQAVERLVNN
jgi:hypothetical protein